MITQDLLTEILIRLPVKSLLICKSVCKPWLSLISNPNFINSHLKHTIRNSEAADQTLIHYQTGDNSMSLLDLNSPELEPSLPLGFPFSKGDSCSDRYNIVGSYNGIVCVSVSNYVVGSNYEWYFRNIDFLNNPNTYLWNPATKQSKLIAPHNIRDNVNSMALGFGFDPIHNDFKVLRIVRVRAKTFSRYNKPFAAEVYSAKTNVWREVDPSPTDYCTYNEFSVCLNGFLCGGGSRGMMAFNLDKEVFACGINLPTATCNYCITDFSDCIAVAAVVEGEYNRWIQLWTLDDEACLCGGGVEASWTVMLTADVNFPDPRVFGCFNCGDLLLYTDDDVCLLYNSYKKEARDVPVFIIIGRQIVKYNESLVSITGSKQVDWNAYEDDSQESSTVSVTSGF